MTIIEAVAALRPGSWTYDPTSRTLTPLDETANAVSIPTLEEIHSYIASKEYRENRMYAYPAIGDQLDALWKGGQSAEDMKAQILAVKAKYPKPL